MFFVYTIIIRAVDKRCVVRVKVMYNIDVFSKIRKHSARDIVFRIRQIDIYEPSSLISTKH